MHISRVNGKSETRRKGKQVRLFIYKCSCVAHGLINQFIKALVWLNHCKCVKVCSCLVFWYKKNIQNGCNCAYGQYSMCT